MRMSYQIWCDAELTWTEPRRAEINHTEDPKEIAAGINKIHEIYLNDGKPLLDEPDYKVVKASGSAVRGVAWLEGGRGHDSVIQWQGPW